MSRSTYQRITDDEVPGDAVTVSIGGATEDELTVSVMWPARGPSVPADEEEGGTVSLALRQAEAVRRQFGFARVVVVIDDPKLWRPGWGKLLL